MGVPLPDLKRWADVYYDDPETATIIKFVQNPGMISNNDLEDAKLNTNFCTALRQSHLMMEDGLLIYCKPIAGSKSYTRLVVVPMQLQNMVFTGFHSNPVGSHLNAARMFHCIRLRFYWPNMYTYITKMCHSCPVCTLSNPTHGKSCKLIYSFPIEAPMMVLHIDGYQAGKESEFEGSSHYLIVCYGMCTFSVMEPFLMPTPQLTHLEL